MITKDNDRNVLRINDEISFDESGSKKNFREKMLLNNKIEGLLEFHVNIINHEKVYEYDTEGLGNLSSLCNRESIGGNRIGRIIKEIARILLRGEKYLLDESNFILDPEFIYLDRDDKPMLAYYSGYGKAFAGQITNLAEYLMNRIDYHDREGVLTIYTIYMKSKEEGFTIRELLSFMEHEKEGELKLKGKEERPFWNDDFHSEIAVGSDEQKLFDYSEDDYFAERIPEPGLQKEKRKMGKVSKTGKMGLAVAVIFFFLVIVFSIKFKLIFGKNQNIDLLKCLCIFLIAGGGGFFIRKKLSGKVNKEKKAGGRNIIVPEMHDDDEATELLSELNISHDTEGKVRLVSDSDPEITVNGFPFYIGKDESHMDFCLNSPGVSRYHAKLDRISENIFISDLNSTNGTYVNGKKLEPNIKKRIIEGDEIRIGKCIYHIEGFH